MIVTVDGCRWRIKGEGCDWQIQYPRKRKDGETWDGKYFFPTLEHAVGKAYELMLRESPASADLGGVPAECARAKAELLEAVRKAAAA